MCKKKELVTFKGVCTLFTLQSNKKNTHDNLHKKIKLRVQRRTLINFFYEIIQKILLTASLFFYFLIP